MLHVNIDEVSWVYMLTCEPSEVDCSEDKMNDLTIIYNCGRLNIQVRTFQIWGGYY